MSFLAPKTFLVYIPCHSDYERARENAAKIRSQFDEIQDPKITDGFVLKIIISVNGVSIPSDKYYGLEKSADFLYCFSESVGGDTNINQGFLKALEIIPDYFWILSANELLVEGSIYFILCSIIQNPDSDLYVTNGMNRSATYLTSNIFIDVPPGSGLGLISSVIYNFPKTRTSFSAGPKFAWTGWGQLAVLQTACNNLGFLKVTEFPDTYVYQKPFTDFDVSSGKSEFEFVRTAYAHSYFGMPILIFALFNRNKKLRNRVLLAWLKVNWFKIRYFKKGAKVMPDPKFHQFDSQWVQQMANLTLHVSGIAIFLLSLMGNLLNFEQFRKNKFFRFMQRNLF